MANLQVKNVPTALQHRLKRYAKKRGRTLREVILEAVTRELEQAEFTERLARRDNVDLDRSAAEILREARAERTGKTEV